MTQEASILAEAAERIFETAAANPDRGFDQATWGRLEEAGFDRLLLPEAQGGAGDLFEDAAAVMVRLGASAAAIPLAETLVANWCLAMAGLSVASGPKSFIASSDPSRIKVEDDRLTWSGALDVPWLPVTGALVAVVPDGQGGSVVAVAEASLDGLSGETIAGEPVLTIEAPAGGLPLSGARPLPRYPGLPLALAALFKAAAIAGALGPVVDMSVEYANTRRQFGRAIGGFQAVQHMLARMACESAATTAAVEFASRADDESLPWRAAIAKARSSEAAGVVGALAHQVHGAIGFTREYTLHRLTRRIWSWREEYGNEAHWNARIGRAVIENGHELWPSMINGLRV